MNTTKEPTYKETFTTSFEFKGKIFKQGDVIVNRRDNIYAVLAEVIKYPFEFLPDAEILAPKFYIAYLGDSVEGHQVVTRGLAPETGIGRMQEFDLATDEEIRKFETLLLDKGHIRYKYPEIHFDYIPVVGDVVAAWNDNDPTKAVVGVVMEVKHNNVVILNNGITYKYTFLFNDLTNYRSIINVKQYG